MLYTALFYYTLTIMLFIAISAATCLSSFLVSRRISFLLGAIMFIFYFFDISFVFHHDFIVQRAIPATESFYIISSPELLIITGCGALGAFWLFLCEKLDKKNTYLQVIPIVVFIAFGIAVLILTPRPHINILLFFANRSLFLCFICGYYFYQYVRRGPDERLKIRPKPLYIYGVIALTLGIIAEDVLSHSIVLPTILAEEHTPFWFFAERNIFENLLFVWLGIMFTVDAWRSLTMHFENPPSGNSSRSKKTISYLLPTYCAKKNLSPREKEVLYLILLGKDNQNIASEMNLALSTVKAHVHNILRKTDTKNRQGLIQDFWKG